ncbi:hypothetical protein D1007_10850 [Hordeum vulgare]|nr:hypothetical protein D1007_10850 [Hordeum vulgare]
MLERSTLVNLEELKKVRLVVAADSNEWGATHISPGSWPRRESASPAVLLHFHALLSGVLVPFSGFLNAMLSHYQIHALHLDPRSLVLLSAFVFLCEAFVGVTPSVAFLRHFFSLELISEVQCSGGASLRTIDARTPGILYAELLPEAEGFRRQWVQVAAAEAGALFQPPPTPATPNRGKAYQRRLLRRSPDIPRPLPLAVHEPQSPEPHARDPPVVFFGGGLRYFGVMPLPSPMAPPGAMKRLPLGPLQHAGEESLASREAKLQEEIDMGVAEARHSLLLDYRAKLRLQESRFLKCHGCLRDEVCALRRRLDEEVESRQAALDTQATTEGKLSNISKHVKGVASLVGEASEEAVHASSLQIECSRMFWSLERRASRTLSDICGEGVNGPLISDDSGYLGFFYRVMEHLEAGAEKALALAEDKRCDLFGQATSDVFNHLLHLDPDFDFASVLDSVPKTICAALAEWVEVHVEDLVTSFALEGHRVGSDDDASL